MNAEHLKEIFFSALEYSHPNVLLPPFLKNRELPEHKGVFLISVGKAANEMASALKNHFPEEIDDGIVLSHTEPKDSFPFTHHLCTHPTVSEKNIENTSKLLKKIASLPSETLVLFALSGGASSMLEHLPPLIPLKDYQITIKHLLHSDIPIERINVIRKHLSLVKGGRLAQLIYPRPCLSYVISDVLSDDLNTIGSGPTYPDSNTFSQALKYLKLADPKGLIPQTVYRFLESGVEGQEHETLKPSHPIFKNFTYELIGTRLNAMEGAKIKAESLGYNVQFLTEDLEGESSQCAQKIPPQLTRVSNGHKPYCWIASGETTVEVTGNGKGGRCQELALSLLNELKTQSSSYLWLAAGTDGKDGPTDTAGAWVDPEVFNQMTSQNLDPQSFMKQNNSYEFFEKTQSLLKTGPTGTNVQDLLIVLENVF